MRAKSFFMRLSLSHSLVMIATLNLIPADPLSTDLFAWDYSSIESNSDDMLYEPEQPGPLPLDLVSDSSLMASELSEFSSSDATGSSNWDSRIQVIAPGSFPLESSCQTESNDLFSDDGLAGDGILKARDKSPATCRDQEEDQTIDSNAPKNIPGVFSPADLTKKKKYAIPSDPSGSIILEYGNCFLPYLTRCCCTGSYAWGSLSIWGYTLTQIEKCSVGTYMFLNKLHVHKDVQVTKFKFKVIPQDYCPTEFNDVCCRIHVSPFSLIISQPWTSSKEENTDLRLFLIG